MKDCEFLIQEAILDYTDLDVFKTIEHITGERLTFGQMLFLSTEVDFIIDD